MMTKACWDNFPNFKPKEFGCGCGCEKEHVAMDCKLLFILQAVRAHYGKPVIITSGHRCQKYNNSLKGSIKNSYHIAGKAADFYIDGYTNKRANRVAIINYMKTLPGFKYAYHNDNGSNPNMGIAIHVEVK